MLKRRLDAELWERTRNPWAILQALSESELRALAGDPGFLESLRAQVKAYREAMISPG